MSEVLKQPAVLGSPEVSLKSARLSSYLPAGIAFAGAGALTLIRMKVGPEHFSTDGALMMLALAAYLIAAVFYLTNLYAPSSLFEKIGLGSATVGVMMNLSSWLVRWIAYREHDVSIWLQQGKPASEWPWVFRNIPFANLYDLSLAFAFGARATTLLIAHRKNFRFLGAVSLPLAGLVLVGAIVLFSTYLFTDELKAASVKSYRRLGWHLIKAALVVQALAIVMLVWQVKTMTHVAACADNARPADTACIDSRQYYRVGVWMAEQDKVPPAQIATIDPETIKGETAKLVSQRQDELFLSLNANPVELAALITAFAGTLFVVIFSFNTEKLRAALPDKEKIDSLMYKTGGVPFPGLALLLMNRARWANESSGHYWQWDSKETGAFVAWLTYGGFLHSRISRGLNWRASAYFAVVAFLLIVFTYLGVSYLLPGMHSYA